MAVLGELGQGLVLSLITPSRPSSGQVGLQNHHMLSGTLKGHLQEITDSTRALDPFSNKQGKGEESKAHRERQDLYGMATIAAGVSDSHVDYYLYILEMYVKNYMCTGMDQSDAHCPDGRSMF